MVCSLTGPGVLLRNLQPRQEVICLVTKATEHVGDPRPPDHSVCHPQGPVSPDARTVPALAAAFCWISPTTRRGGLAPEPGAGVRAPIISEDSSQRERHGGPCVYVCVCARVCARVYMGLNHDYRAGGE